MAQAFQARSRVLRLGIAEGELRAIAAEARRIPAAATPRRDRLGG